MFQLQVAPPTPDLCWHAARIRQVEAAAWHELRAHAGVRIRASLGKPELKLTLCAAATLLAQSTALELGGAGKVWSLGPRRCGR